MASRILVLFAVTALAIVAFLGGCKDPTIIGYELKPVETGPVEAYGLILDENSPPQDVVFVMFRAVLDDIQAAREHNREAQLEALNLQASIAASAWMHATFQRALDRKSMPVQVTPEQSVFKLIRFWAPMLGHYIDSVATDHDILVDGMSVGIRDELNEAVVRYDLSGKDGTTATAQIELIREGGYWRIKKLGFADTNLAATLSPKDPSSANIGSDS